MIEVSKLDQQVRNFILKKYPLFYTSLDNYLKWTPFFCVLFLEGSKVKMKNSIKERVIILSVAEAILKTIVLPVKKISKERRPNLALKKNSFPSGHAATSFMGAELMRQQLREYYPIMSLSGYTIAIITGILRLFNNKHWLSDVISGAIIGFIAARMARKIFSLIERHLELTYSNAREGKILPLYDLPHGYNFPNKK